MTIGQTIRHYRKHCQLTQAQLAQKVGVSVQAISKWETWGDPRRKLPVLL